MTALEQIYKSGSKHKLVCVKYKNGGYDRIEENKAYNLVKNGTATYVGKEEYKAFTRNVVKKEKVEVVKETVEQTEKPKRKKKEIRADNKKGK